jgi:hypothetical protein
MTRRMTLVVLTVGVPAGLALFTIEANGSQGNIYLWIGPIIFAATLVVFAGLSALLMRYGSQMVKLVLEEVQPPL